MKNCIQNTQHVQYVNNKLKSFIKKVISKPIIIKQKHVGIMIKTCSYKNIKQ